MAHAESAQVTRHGKKLGGVMDYLVEVNGGYVRVTRLRLWLAWEAKVKFFDFHTR